MVVIEPGREDCVLVSSEDFCEALTLLDLYRTKFEGLLRVTIQAHTAAKHTPEAREHFRPIESWIHNNYIDLREHLPPELKRLYLHEIAFSST
jgi:hypothetical protein